MAVERVVLDSNVLISAVISPLGKPSRCLVWVLENAALIMAESVIEEVETRLSRPRFAKYVDDAKRRAFIADLRAASLLVELTGELRACRDPDDDKLLETAVLGNADCLVTGDKDLLVLDPFQGIPIITPSQFLGVIVSVGDAAP
jgi:uncharacterized protein